ncbi:thiol-disulfide isomerase/thioredoxin [Gillisia sp. Hel_I_86]|uniref:TlpA family protein disulfide reductase n=1 Tax=Gillisia sp. Hel_I_86 TaxID=1249981 RepID=UPI00119A2CFA|nr:TlpA disulfide reductase family protein [Gillisia sp. Hel_I_86]TVZ27232.1 thiol-disulfide isomerase/thioredoxin [Gillisia sp. Hel_I_86]
MRLNTIISIITIFLIFSCGNKKTEKIIYYKTPNGKIITSKAFDSMKVKLSEHGKLDKVIITSMIEKGDSIIKSYLIGVVPTDSDGKPINPFGNAEKFIEKKLPFNSLTTIKGELLNIDDLKGKPTLINFWFINCPPCIKEMPELNAIKEHYGNSVNFLAITFDTKEKVSVFLKKMKFDFIHITDSKNEIDKIGNEAYPMNMFLDKNGVVRFVRGNLTEKDGKDFKMIIDKLL